MPEDKSYQLSLFDDNSSNLPLPERIAQGGHDWRPFSLAYHDVDGIRYYAVIDWIRGITFTPDASKFWNHIKTRLKKSGIDTSLLWRQLSYTAKNGGSYKVSYATAEGLYLITQRMDADTGIRNKVLAFLAKAGVVVDEFNREPQKAIDAGIAAYRRQGKDDKWIEARIDSKIKRNHFTEALRSALSKPEPRHYAQATNDVYVGLWERTAEQLRIELGIGKHISLRDHFPTLALAYNTIAEEVIGQKLGQSTELTWQQAEEIIKRVAALVRPQIIQMSDFLGIDLVTGRPVLAARSNPQ